MLNAATLSSAAACRASRATGAGTSGPERARVGLADSNDVSHATATGYHVSQADKDFFDANGYVVLRQVLTEEEMASQIDPTYFAFLEGKIRVPGRDAMEMGAGALAAAAEAGQGPWAGAVAAGGRGEEGQRAERASGDGAGGALIGGFALYNVMLPRMHHGEWQGNAFERRAKDIADQLKGGDMVIDFDQIFAKAPQSGGSAFQWHQDLAYWPDLDADPSSATCWLAVSDATLENGCLRYLPGSHLEGALRKHYTVGSSRAAATTLFTPVDESRERPVPAPVSRGDLIVHHERCLHASTPNRSDSWRHVYVLSMHKREWVEAERSLGITYSYNDPVSWQSWNRWELLSSEEAAAGGGLLMRHSGAE